MKYFLGTGFAAAISGIVMTVAAAAAAPAPPIAGARDAQHDFDFEIGTWKTHLKRLIHPLSGGSSWVELDGTTVVRQRPKHSGAQRMVRYYR